jgi:hypothetical protein
LESEQRAAQRGAMRRQRVRPAAEMRERKRIAQERMGILYSVLGRRESGEREGTVSKNGEEEKRSPRGHDLSCPSMFGKLARAALGEPNGG